MHTARKGRTLVGMEDRLSEAAQFAAIIVGADGVNEDGPEPGTPLAEVLELTRRLESEGIPEAEIDARVKALWGELWSAMGASERLHPELRS